MNDLKELSVVIVTRNSQNEILKCLESLSLWDKHIKDVVLVDNASSDNTLERVREFQKVKVISENRNTGFSKAVNKGIGETSGKYILILNPDVEIINDFYQEIRNLFESNNNIGIIGPKIVYPDGTFQRSVRRLPDLISQIIMFLKLDHIYGGFTSVKRYSLFDFDYNKPQYVDQVMGACFFTRRDLWDKLSGFDERFFIWFEEVDYCLRAKSLGMLTYYAPLGPVRHILGKSFSQERLLRKQLWFLKSLIYFFWKHLLK